MTSATCSLQCPSRSSVRNAPRVRGNLENNYYEEGKKKKNLISGCSLPLLTVSSFKDPSFARTEAIGVKKKIVREEKSECSRRLCLFSCSFSRCFVPSPVSNSCTGKTDFHIDFLLLLIDVNKMFTRDEIERADLNLVWQFSKHIASVSNFFIWKNEWFLWNQNIFYIFNFD